MKATLIGILFVALLAPLAMAGESSHNNGADAEQRLKQLSERLHLTDEQKQKLTPILQSEVGELRAIHNKYATDKSSRSKKQMGKDMKTVTQKYEPQISAILTPEQQAEWKKIKEEGKEKAKHKAKEKQKHEG